MHIIVGITEEGIKEILDYRLYPSESSENYREMLEDLIAAAVNDAMRRGEALSQEKMSGFTAGLNLPPGFKLPF